MPSTTRHSDQLPPASHAPVASDMRRYRLHVRSIYNSALHNSGWAACAPATATQIAELLAEVAAWRTYLSLDRELAAWAAGYAVLRVGGRLVRARLVHARLA
jgi:hypothetical protein